MLMRSVLRQERPSEQELVQLSELPVLVLRDRSAPASS